MTDLAAVLSNLQQKEIQTESPPIVKADEVKITPPATTITATLSSTGWDVAIKGAVGTVLTPRQMKHLRRTIYFTYQTYLVEQKKLLATKGKVSVSNV